MLAFAGAGGSGVGEDLPSKLTAVLSLEGGSRVHLGAQSGPELQGGVCACRAKAARAGVRDAPGAEPVIRITPSSESRCW